MAGPFDVTIEKARIAFPEYEFVKRLALSSHKAAFHVRDASLTDLCLKIISPLADISRIQREIESLQKLNHPNIVKLHHYEFTVRVEGNRHFSIEEFVPGHDLTDLLAARTPWPSGRATAFFSALADGLAAIGAMNIVHRDLKPSNIRVRTDDTPSLWTSAWREF